MAREATCNDWTASDGSFSGKPRVGHSRPTGGLRAGAGGVIADGMADWMSPLDEAVCEADIRLANDGAVKPGANGGGLGSGYDGFYCFALSP
jgi:hypothetical protein